MMKKNAEQIIFNNLKFKFQVHYRGIQLKNIKFIQRFMIHCLKSKAIQEIVNDNRQMNETKIKQIIVTGFCRLLYALLWKMNTSTE